MISGHFSVRDSVLPRLHIKYRSFLLSHSVRPTTSATRNRCNEKSNSTTCLPALSCYPDGWIHFHGHGGMAMWLCYVFTVHSVPYMFIIPVTFSIKVIYNCIMILEKEGVSSNFVGRAFHSTKNFGLHFRIYQVANGTAFSQNF